MLSFVLLSEKSWHENLFQDLNSEFSMCKWYFIRLKSDFNLKSLKEIQPDKIFIPHWSHMISNEIFDNFECVVFHMTDLPYGRGGSPLQNLIVRGHKETKISALKVEQGLDTGPVYLKEKLSLVGNASEIFERASVITGQMIKRIIKEGLSPLPQEGKPTVFKRRKSEDGNIRDLENIGQVYDYIRMLDAEGYPPAFLEFGNFKLEFSGVSTESEKTLLANVRIIKK